jgi:hypothetical protein
MYLLWLAPAPEGAADVPDAFTSPGPTVLAKTWLPLNVNAIEIARSETTFDIAVIVVSFIRSRSGCAGNGSNQQLN